jgi:serine/threonine-protein kinase
MESLKGSRLGRYILLERISANSNFEVYFAYTNGENGARVPATLKISKSCKGSPLQNEAKILRNLGHQAFCSMLAADFRGTHPYLALEYVEGASVEDIIASQLSRGPNLELAIHIGVQVAVAIADLQKARAFSDDEHGIIIHGDICPKNLLVNLQGEVKIIDFGSARVFNSAGTSNISASVSNWRYASPERAQFQKADVRDDIFALGLILWELCTAKRYWGVMTNEEISKSLNAFVVKDLARENPALPKELREIIMNCLSSEYFGGGYTDAEDLVRDLSAIRRKGPRAMKFETYLRERLPLVVKRLEMRRHELQAEAGLAKLRPAASDSGSLQPKWFGSFKKIFQRS